MDAASDPVAASIQSPLSTAVVTALLQILDTDKDRAETLQIFLYISIVFNLGATTCAVLCLFMLSDFTTKARVIAATDNTSLPKECLLDDVMLYRYIEEDRERELLRNFGLGRPWSIATATMNYCFLCGTVCTFVGLGIGVWYRCINFAAGVIVTTALGLVGGASGLVLMLLISGNASDISCSAVKKRTFCSRSTWEESLEAGCRMQRKGMATAGEEGGGAALTRQD